MAKRVFQVAKELGVKSTAIVAKCQAEGLDIKNHMSTLSAGLEATIFEWFSEGEHATTVETSARVDLEKVKTKAPRKRKKQVEAAAAAEEAEPITVEADKGIIAEAAEPLAVEAAEPALAEVIEPTPGAALELEVQPVDVAQTKAKAKKDQKPRRLSPKEVAAEELKAPPASEVGLPPGALAAGAAPETKPKKKSQRARKKALAAKAPPDKPEKPSAPKKEAPAEPEIIPAKPHVPEPAKLQGPKVIRVERPDTAPPPRRREPRRRTIADLWPKKEAPPTPEVPQKETVTPRRSRRRAGLSDEKRGDQEPSKRSKPRARKRRGSRGYEISEVAVPHEWGDRDLQEREERLAAASGRKLIGRARRLARDEEALGTGLAVQPRRIEKATVKEPITVKELSAAIGVRINEIIPKLMQMGVIATVNQVLEADAAMTVALEFGVDLAVEEELLLLDQLQQEFDKEASESDLQPRPPVVAFLGHVDHGKTSLLDRIRKTKVTDDEAGGITQHIGSYLYDDGKRRVAFLDTPGHKAFTAMRARGANMTDIVVLVVAADDGVMPQTEEAISHARAAGVPIMVALNKVDLPSADFNRVLGQLSEKELVPTEWGGETEVVRTSAVTGEGIDDLIEHLDYVTELGHLKARFSGPATGWVVEAEMATGQGVLARLLVSNGILRPGSIILSGSSCGRIRTMVDATKKPLSEAGPATPVEVTGFDSVPTAGERFFVVDNISRATAIADEQWARQREKTLGQRRRVTLENLFSEIEAGQVKELNVILKADVQGSVDVLRKSITEMNTREVAVRILHAAVGGISESDVLLAEASNAIIIGFQVVAEEHARTLAEREGVEIRLYRVIYDISDDIKKALEGMLAPRIEERQTGRLEVRQIFKISRVGSIAGCYMVEGVIQRSSLVRLIRENIVIRDNMTIDSLRRVKNDVSEVRSGLECGVKLAGFDDVKVGDIIEVFEQVEISRSLEIEQEQPV